MRLASIAAHTVRWPIAATGAARGRGERAAVIVEVRGESGAIGLGEAAPLPGMSRDTLAACEEAIAAVSRRAPLSLDPGALPALDGAPPAARFAIETALCDAIARDRRISVAALLAAPAVPLRGASVPLAAVVDDAGAARRAVAAGIRCLKIKLTAEDAVDRAFAIAAAAPGARLRVDANRTWPRAEVADRLAALATLAIEYVEEPCPQAHRLLAASLPCRIALDESLGELAEDELAAALASPQLAAVILKPALLGGLSAALAIAARARRGGVAAVASHALEGPVGTAACAELALALGGDVPAGLARHAALDGWSIDVAQIAADCVRPAGAPGLGFAGLDLAGVLAACPGASR